jgi:hypothetical protein
LLGLFSQWLGGSHKDKFALSPVWLNKLHEALVINDIVKVRVDATVFVQVLKSVIVRFLNVEQFPFELPLDFWVLEEKIRIIKLRQ